MHLSYRVAMVVPDNVLFEDNVGQRLVPQDPNDEPASMLLTRIRVEQHPHRPMKKNSKARRGAIRAREAR